MGKDWKIEPCSVADAPALARNNIVAFWEDPSWTLLWPKEIKLEFLVEQSAKRLSRNLLRNRGCLRHQKAVEPGTGDIVGYARWVLPADRSSNEDGSIVWAEAQVPPVSDHEESQLEQQAEKAWWKPRSDMDGMDDEIDAVMSRIVADKAFIQLDYMAVHPERKGQGIATALVQKGLKAADEIDVPVLTIAFNAARNIYTRLGFKEADRVVQDLSQYGGIGEYATYLMIRDVMPV